MLAVPAESLAQIRTLRSRGELDAAEQLCMKALTRWPTMVEGWLELGSLHLARGVPSAAVEGFRMALRLLPGRAEILHNLSVALGRAGDAAGAADSRQAAIVAYKRQLADSPRNNALRYGLGMALSQAGHPRAAARHLRHVVLENPRHLDACINLGHCFQRLGLTGQATTIMRHALSLAPSSPDARWNLAVSLLAQGRLVEAWPFYESRLHLQRFGIQGLSRPRWSGQTLPEATVLLQAEQGLGDTLQFIRFCRPVAERVGRVVLRCQGPLVPLLRGLPELAAVSATAIESPPHDHAIHLMSLPGLFGLSLSSPALCTGPYLHPDPELVAQWRAWLEDLPGLRIGICWQGNPAYEADDQRSFPLRSFRALSSIPGVQLISLQKRHGLDQLRELGGPMGVNAPELDTTTGPFQDTAALIASLDLVISSDTAVAHLAGGLGRPVWVPLAFLPDWRYPRSGRQMPWYPSMRLFRQPVRGDWGAVFAEMAEAVRGLQAG